MPTLSPERWQQVSPYLDQVLSLPESERRAWLESFRVQRPDLAGLLQDLLEEHRALAQEKFLERPPIEAAYGTSLPGQNIGAYTLMSPIGQGGMGTVWLAERSDERFERRVAIKFLHLSIAAHGIERFKREGRILGQLTHPNIAALIDAGVTAKGEPYLVLENVEGEHIDEYCDHHKLDIDARIRLFLDVLGAVAHAHANLIVHRDLKPSNVLVTNDGKVKLLDFGIAKLLGDETNPAAETALTMEGGGALTPLFAAPEQVTAGTVTTATDVYALGVLLYILLTGQHPAGSELHSPAELVKAIVETEPPLASDAIVSAASKDVAPKRSTTPEKLSRQLRGDLDTILAKTLKKAPAERYSSVTAFEDDLRRYLKHEPINARPDTIAYRVAKFVRRNRLSVGVGTLALAAVLGASGVAVYQARLSQKRFQDVRKLAHTFVFDLHDEIAKLEGSTKAREMMVRTGLEYLDNLSRNAGHDQELQKEIAAAYLKMGDAQGFPTRPNLGRTADALVSYQKAGDIYRKLSAQNSAYLADLAKYYGTYAALVRFTDLKQARGLAELAIETFDRIRSQRPLDDSLEAAYALSWCGLGDMDEDMGHYRDTWTDISRCSSLAHASVEKARNTETLTLLSVADERLGTAAAEVGLLDVALRGLDEDESVLNELLTAEPQNPRLHRKLALVYQFRAHAYYSDTVPSLGDAARALPSAKRYLELARQMAQSDPANRAAKFSQASALFQISLPLREFDPPAAVRMAEDSVRMFDEMIASGKPTYLVSSGRVYALLRLGEAQLKAGRLAEARRTARLALDDDRALAPTTAADAEERVVWVLILMLAGHVEAANGDPRSGERFLLQARDEAAQFADSSELAHLVPLASAEKALGDFYISRARTDEARSCYQRLVQLWDRFPETNDYVSRQRVASKELLASLRSSNPLR